MKRFVTIIALTAISLPSCALAASLIPSQFQGVWGDKQECATHKEYGTGIKITPTEINGYEGGCTLKSIVSTDATSLKGTARCANEGSYSTEKVNMTLRNGKLVYNGRPAMSRCL